MTTLFWKLYFFAALSGPFDYWWPPTAAYHQAEQRMICYELLLELDLLDPDGMPFDDPHFQYATPTQGYGECGDAEQEGGDSGSCPHYDHRFLVARDFYREAMLQDFPPSWSVRYFDLSYAGAEQSLLQIRDAQAQVGRWRELYPHQVESHWFPLEQRLSSIEEAYKCFRYSTADHYGWRTRRENLFNLRECIGYANFYAGRMPHPAPLPLVWEAPW